MPYRLFIWGKTSQTKILATSEVIKANITTIAQQIDAELFFFKDGYANAVKDAAGTKSFKLEKYVKPARFSQIDAESKVLVYEELRDEEKEQQQETGSSKVDPIKVNELKLRKTINK